MGDGSAVIPSPASIHRRNDEFALARACSLSVGDPALVELATCWRETLSRLADIELPEPVVEDRVAAEPAVRITSGVVGAAPGVPPPSGRRADDAFARREAHSLDVDERGIRIRAAHPEGIHRGLTTILQQAGPGNGAVPYARGFDTPRFAWRGLSLDTVRTFVPIGELERVIDVLSLYKMNVLHLHVTDDEGWRLEIQSWPQLTDEGGRGARGDRPGGFYTQDEFRALVAYGRE